MRVDIFRALNKEIRKLYLLKSEHLMVYNRRALRVRENKDVEALNPFRSKGLVFQEDLVLKSLAINNQVLEFLQLKLACQCQAFKFPFGLVGERGADFGSGVAGGQGWHMGSTVFLK